MRPPFRQKNWIRKPPPCIVSSCHWSASRPSTQPGNASRKSGCATASGGKAITIFESGAILLYLAEKTGKLVPRDVAARWAVTQWVFLQAASIGPMFGQHAHFFDYAPEDVPYAKDRYLNEVRRLYGMLDQRLPRRREPLGQAARREGGLPVEPAGRPVREDGGQGPPTGILDPEPGPLDQVRRLGRAGVGTLAEDRAAGDHDPGLGIHRRANDRPLVNPAGITVGEPDLEPRIPGAQDERLLAQDHLRHELGSVTRLGPHVGEAPVRGRPVGDRGGIEVRPFPRLAHGVSAPRPTMPARSTNWSS